MEKEPQVWREDAELSFELAEIEGWYSGEIQAQDTNQRSLAGTEMGVEAVGEKSRVESRA